MTSIALLPCQVDQRVALHGVRFTTHLSGLTNKTVVEQTFINEESVDIEAIYTFPLPVDAAVCSFEVITGERVLTGIVKDREEARDDYDDAIDRGDAAYMADQIRPDVFSVRVGNIKPRQAATIRLTYIAPLKPVDGIFRLSFPTTIAPRYATDSGTDPITAMLDGDALNPPNWLNVPYGLTVEINVALGARMRSITSPSHELVIEDDGDARHKITLAGGLSVMNRDLVVKLEPEKEDQPHVVVGEGPDGAKYAAVTFIPEFDEELLADPPPNETIFLLDCSGSMGGHSIAQAKQALELCLNSLSEGDSFNIYRFGSTYESMHPKSVPYNHETWQAARRYVSSIDANLGGTEILSPLSEILAWPLSVGTCRQVIVLTDGQVSNEPAVIRQARDHSEHNRIFTIGIGPASSAYLVNGLAQATGGTAEFVTRGERVEDKVLRTFSRIASPTLSNVQVDWSGETVELSSARIPPVFDGDALRVVGRISGDLPSQVTLRCESSAGEKVSWTLDVPSAQQEHELVAYQWARDVLAGCDENPDRHQRKRYLEISRRFNLLCPLTSFVAIEHRSEEERNSGRPALREVPVMLAEGWGAIERGCMVAGAVPLMDVDVLCEFDEPRGVPSATRLGRSAVNVFNAIFGRDDSSADVRIRDDAGVNLNLMTLLKEQNSAGAFREVWHCTELSTPIKNRLGQLNNLADRLFERFGSVTNVDPAVTGTLAVLCILSTDFADDCDIWRRAANKGTRFVAKRLSLSRADVTAFVDELVQSL